jgi:hypothetical protein
MPEDCLVVERRINNNPTIALKELLLRKLLRLFSTPADEAYGVRICPRCKAEITDATQKFCTWCGSSL